MSKEPSDELFTLIKALTRSEKRYVKQELQKHVIGEVSQSALLFDAVAAQETYDEEKIRIDYADRGFTRRLPEAKRELMHVILRAMRSYHYRKNSSRRAISAILDAEFLRLRGLFRLAEKKLQEALYNAKLSDNEVIAALAYSTLNDLNHIRGNWPAPHTDPAQDDLVATARNLEESSYIGGLSARMEGLVSMFGQSPTPAAKVLASDLVKLGEQRFPLHSASAKNEWLRLLSQKALFIDNDHALALRYDRSRLDVLENNPEYKAANMHMWVNLVHSVALRLLIVGNVQAAIPLRNDLFDFWNTRRHGLTPHNRRSIGAQYINIEIQIALQSFNFEQLYNNLAHVDAVLAETEELGPSETGIACQLNIAICLFGLEKYGECIQRLFLIDGYPEDVRPELHTAKRLLLILCHINLSNESVVTSLVRSERRRYRDQPIPKDVELFLSVAIRTFTTKPGRPLRNLYIRSLEELLSLQAASQATITSTIEFRSWLLERIHRKPWRTFLSTGSEVEPSSNDRQTSLA